MLTYAVTVKKEYAHRRSGNTKILYGQIQVEAGSAGQAEEKVNRMMLGQAGEPRVLQTVDPRIEWEEDFTEGDGWDYLDWSFAVVRGEAQESEPSGSAER